MTAATRGQAAMPRPDSHVIVVFGATGDLARRKLLPGLYGLAEAGLLPERYQIIGTSPAARAPSEAEFRARARDAVAQFGARKPGGGQWQRFEDSLHYAGADTGDPAPLVAAVRRAEQALGGQPRRLFHLAVPPPAFEPVIGMLGASGLAEGPSRVIIEKPFGTDLASARALNARIHQVFDESQVFRIDHFLGKESVDNILALRFANGIFEPVWNRQHISYVQIDVPETLSIEGRAGFYERTGAYRDMVVTHLLQVLGIVAMEPPASLSARALRDEKEKVFESMPPIDVRQVVRGQYAGYQDEPGVAPGTQTETFVAVRAAVDNWRWSGVPFCLRTGKALGASRQLVTLGFHQPAIAMFPVDRERCPDGPANRLAIDFQDPGSITAHFLAKEPGPQMVLGAADMTFRYGESFSAQHDLEGYQRLIHDAMLGDQTLFTRADGIERLWEISGPLLDNPPPAEPYQKGSWGPESASRIAAPYRWSLPEPDPPARRPA
ncbi:MAG TPA: glucose-6-phosphate dehydrogenase [Streptosporangiaceae bacterium]|jgi:glucose-6-phosphate 1-dehydrogenase